MSHPCSSRTTGRTADSLLAETLSAGWLQSVLTLERGVAQCSIVSKGLRHLMSSEDASSLGAVGRAAAALALCNEPLLQLVRRYDSSLTELSRIVFPLGVLQAKAFLPNLQISLPLATQGLSDAFQKVLARKADAPSDQGGQGRDREGRSTLRNLLRTSISALFDDEAISAIERDEARNDVRQQLAFWADLWRESVSF